MGAFVIRETTTNSVSVRAIIAPVIPTRYQLWTIVRSTNDAKAGNAIELTYAWTHWKCGKISPWKIREDFVVGEQLYSGGLNITARRLHEIISNIQKVYDGSDWHPQFWWIQVYIHTLRLSWAEIELNLFVYRHDRCSALCTFRGNMSADHAEQSKHQFDDFVHSNDSAVIFCICCFIQGVQCTHWDQIRHLCHENCENPNRHLESVAPFQFSK